MSRFLLEPCNNTLSHIAKCLALREVLEARGHEVFLAVSQARAGFLQRLGQNDYFVLPDIQEADARPAPTFAWFRPERVEFCVRAELNLLNKLKPDAVLGVFRFTGPLSAQLAGVPYDSLICGSMTPACPDVLGFAEGEAGAEEQAAALHFFRKTCAQRMRPAFSALGLEAVDDAWRLLAGRRTLLWDFPEFQPLPAAPGYHHVGPPRWSGWPRREADNDALDRLEDPIAYVAFGTGQAPPRLLRHLVEALWRLGYAVALALGGQATATDLPVSPARLAVFEFLAVEQALARAALVVCHGGQLLVFEAMRQRIPVFVLPLQPEQAQNGICVERMGCGRRLLRGMVFNGQADAIEIAFLARPVDEIAQEIAAILADQNTAACLERASEQIGRYRGTATLAELLETTP
ncbi:MAG: glycosyl transferase [Pseudomonadota bacterium]|nr:glycosyl transferase [Pseudomonadota bacterium]MDP1903229.1 glycosyl transferase [Pseudomonadota bacterium]MDP2352738.1 glycosyl transferase [Pseudomonadota bacterium]